LTQENFIGVLNYGAGNIRSIVNAFEYLGCEIEPVSDARMLRQFTHLVLPGVGAFGYCLEKLKKSGLIPPLEVEVIDNKKPLLGICVGMQLLADCSHEYGSHEGLGWIGGSVTKLISSSRDQRVPHVGWNSVEFKKELGVLDGKQMYDFYFDHTFAFDAVHDSSILATSKHTRTFPSVLRKDNILASQFHPEKSQKVGLEFLNGFIEMAN
jgi:glutamine amidotransferase